MEGSLEKQDAIIRFIKDGEPLAVATVGRDLDSLKAGRGFELALQRA